MKLEVFENLCGFYTESAICSTLKQHCGETIFQQKSGFTKLEVLENPCGTYTKAPFIKLCEILEKSSFN